MKALLIDYEPTVFEALNSTGSTYILTIDKLYLFGLIKRRQKINYTVPHDKVKIYEHHWDRVIKRKLVVSINKPRG